MGMVDKFKPINELYYDFYSTDFKIIIEML